jgi:putative intracellular protease/amidase
VDRTSTWTTSVCTGSLILAAAGRIAGDATAQAIQLGIEYDPQPPYDAGSPDKAPGELVAVLRANPDLVLS